MADSIWIFDDSFGCQGGHTEQDYNDGFDWICGTLGATDNGVEGITGNGYAASGDNPAFPASFGWSSAAVEPTGCVPTFFKRLQSVYPTANNQNQSRSGGGYSTALSLLQDLLLATTDRPDVILMPTLGTNPAIAGGNAGGSDFYQEQIDDLYALCQSTATQFVLVGTIPSLNADQTYDPTFNAGNTDWVDQVDAMNAYITQEYVNYDKFYLVDMFTMLGGHSIDLADWQTNNIHPNDQGSEKIGITLYNNYASIYAQVVLGMTIYGDEVLDLPPTDSTALANGDGGTFDARQSAGKVMTIAAGEQATVGLARINGKKASGNARTLRWRLYEAALDGSNNWEPQGNFVLERTVSVTATDTFEVHDFVGSDVIDTEGTYIGVAVPDGETFTLATAGPNGTGAAIEDDDGLSDPWLTDTTKLRTYAIWFDAEVQAITGSPTLTTPYSIGTDGGPLYTITTSDTLATIEAAGFFDGNAGYASLLKTGDVVLIKASNGSKLYNVTVEPISRTITLSTGTAIA